MNANRMTAEQITRLAKAKFGPEYYAVARKGRRTICTSQIGSLGYTVMGEGKTWSEAWRQVETVWNKARAFGVRAEG